MSYQPLTYRKDGGDTYVIASGGKISVESGGEIEIESGGTLTIADGALETPDLALAEGSIVVGDSAGQGSAVDASTDAQILVGDGTTLASVAVSGDVTIDNAGAVTIANDAVETAMIADGQVTTAKLADESVTAPKTSGVAVLYNLGAPDLADPDLIVTTTNMKVGEYTVAAQPDIPRNITVTATAVGAADTPGTITVAGTNYLDEVITEDIIPAQGSTVAGALAFKTVTSVTGAGWVIGEGNDTITVGTGNELGCHASAAATTDIMLAILGQTITAHNPTVGTPEAIEETTIDLSAGTYDGSKEVLVFQKN